MTARRERFPRHVSSFSRRACSPRPADPTPRSAAQQRAARRPGGFTLAEMIVVIGIIILLIGIAVPAVRALTGSRNVGAAYNEVSAIIGQARQDAMAQSNTYPYHGVVFYLNGNTDRVMALFVEGSYPLSTSVAAGTQVWLDVTPGRNQIALPNGIGLNTINNPANNTTDRYLGFNPSLTANKFGGAILFDTNGRLVSLSYCLLCGGTPNIFGGGTLSQWASGAQPSATPIPNTSSDSSFSNTYPVSQFGLVLFDRDAYLNQGYGDGNYQFDPSVSSYNSAKDAWLDQYSTPILINRYNGTLVKGE